MNRRSTCLRFPNRPAAVDSFIRSWQMLHLEHQHIERGRRNTWDFIESEPFNYLLIAPWGLLQAENETRMQSELFGLDLVIPMDKKI